jgi:hypothetical protein
MEIITIHDQCSPSKVPRRTRSRVVVAVDVTYFYTIVNPLTHNTQYEKHRCSSSHALAKEKDSDLSRGKVLEVVVIFHTEKEDPFGKGMEEEEWDLGKELKV